MNKKLQALAKKAGISVLYEYDGYDGHAAVCNLADIEKFAELIINDCCEQLEKEQYEHFDINRVPRTFYNAALYDGIVAIKKHFGVEE